MESATELSSTPALLPATPLAASTSSFPRFISVLKVARMLGCCAWCWSRCSDDHATAEDAHLDRGQTSQCSATVMGTGSFSSGVTWTASAGTISGSGLFTAPSAGNTSLQVTITAISTQDNSKSGSAIVMVNPAQAVNNVQPIVLDAGPQPQTFTDADEAFTSVTICVHGTNTCQTIDHIQVDTGSEGLRLISSVLTTALPPGK